MKRLFYLGLFSLILFELANIYFIMPMPGSQQMNSLDLAYFLYQYRWLFRILCLILLFLGGFYAFRKERRWIPTILLLVAAYVIYQINFSMSADHMFLQPEKLLFESREKSMLPDSCLVLSIQKGDEAKAYPIRFLVYHHQVRDTIDNIPVMITYCSVCRTGRVFEPMVDNQPENFRLVGMDHFNAMFEDQTTKSWWRQVSGEAVAGPLKGKDLPEFPSYQSSLGSFFDHYPNGRVMRLDEASKSHYDSLAKFEYGRSESKLTGTDSLSWKDKSWVIGVETETASKAYDWNLLKDRRIIHDQIDRVPVLLVLSSDNQSFMAFQRPDANSIFQFRNDSIFQDSLIYNLLGIPVSPETPALKRLKAYQEFWHSWKTFHPLTKQFNGDE